MAIGGAGSLIGLYLNIYRDASIPIWVWIGIGVLSIFIVQFLVFHRVRVQRDRALAAEQSLVLTPHTWAIGLSGMTGYPDEPENADWLYLGVAVNPIKKTY